MKRAFRSLVRLAFPAVLLLFSPDADAQLCIQPQITFSPASQDFGSVAIGSSRTLSMTAIYNRYQGTCPSPTGCNCAFPSSVSFTLVSTNARFAVTSTTLTATDNIPVSFQVTFTPNSEGIQNGSIRPTNISFSSIAAVPASVVGVGFVGQPNINLNRTDFDFGDVVVNTTSSQSLTIRNEGSATLTGTLSTSGAPFSVSSASFSLAPGTQQSVSVRFTPTSASPTDITGSLTVQSNDPDAGRLVLVLRGRGIVPYHSVTPSQVNFGLIPVGETLTKTVTISSTACVLCPDSPTLTLSNFRISGAGFAFTGPSDLSLAPGESTTVRVSFGSSTANDFLGALTFQTSDPSAPTKTVALTGEADVSSLDPSTMNIDFGDTHVGSTASRSLSLRNRGTSSLTVSGISSSSPRVTVSPTSATISPGATQAFTVRYTPQAATFDQLATEVLGGALTVSSNDRTIPSLRIDLSGRAVSARLDPLTALDFGSVYIGDDRTDLLTLTNSGTENLIVQNVVSNQASVTPLQTSLTIPPSGTGTIAIQFSPNLDGSLSSTLTLSVANDAFNSSIRTTRVTGIGVPSLDLSLSKVEITQAIQDDANSLPLVAEKKTAVRAFFSSTVRGLPNLSHVIRNVDGLLTIYKNGTRLVSSPLPSYNGPIDVVPTPNRAEADDTLNFIVPAGWLTGQDGDTWDFEVVVNPPSGARVARLLENSYANNSLRKEVRLRNNYRPRIHYIPVNYDQAALPSLDSMVEGPTLLKKIFPLSGIDYVQRPPITFNRDLAIEENRYALLAQLFFASHLGDVPPPDRTYGWLTTTLALQTGYSGYAYVPGRVAFGVGQSTFAHEMGHTYGLCHTHNLNVDGSCPGLDAYRDGHLVEYGSITEVGFDVETGEAVPPVPPSQYQACCVTITCTIGQNYVDCSNPDADDLPDSCSRPPSRNCNGEGAIDVMSYRQNTDQTRWIHPQRYESLFLSLRNRDTDPSKAWPCDNANLCTAFMESSLLVAGTLSDQGLAEIHPIYAAESIPDLVDATSWGSGISLRALDQSGQPLYEYPLEPISQGDGQTAGPSGFSFTIVVPDMSGLTTLQVLKDGTVVAERARAGQPPVLQLLSPTGGATFSNALDVRWEASDPDGDTLLYSVLYSDDGGAAYQAIGVDLTGTSFLYDVSKLPGSAAALIRVVCSDGFHNTIVQSDPFTIDFKPPQIVIASPKDGETFFSGISISLAASVLDPEEPDFPPESIHWTSDLSGDLGSGNPVLASLPEGTHTLVATATDRDGLSASANVQISIVDGASAPRADAGKDQTVEEEAPVTLNASASRDPNEGDTLSFSWTQTSGPTVALDDPAGTATAFSAPKVDRETLLTFRLTVTDSAGHAATDSVDVLVSNVHFAALGLSETELDFGTVPVGDSAERTVTVSNTGDEPLEIQAMNLSRPVFSADPTTLTLAPGSSTPVRITFAPTEEARYEATLRFESNTVAGVPTTVVLRAATPDPLVLYNDNGVGGSLLPENLGIPDPSPDSSGDLPPPADGSGAPGAGGCSLIN